MWNGLSNVEPKSSTSDLQSGFFPIAEPLGLFCDRSRLNQGQTIRAGKVFDERPHSRSPTNLKTPSLLFAGIQARCLVYWVYREIGALPPLQACNAPYKSSSLASRFWGQETGDEEKEVEGLGGGEGPTLEREEPSCRGPRMGRVMDELGEFEGSILNGGIKIMETGEEGGGGGIGRGWVLTRCKSEPARSGERLIKTAPCL